MKLLATGNTAEVFDYETEKVLKLYKDGYPLEYIKMEFENTKIMNKSPVKTPVVYEIVEYNGRHGIVFEKIEGQDLYTEYFNSSQDEQSGNRLLSDLSKIQKTLLNFTTSQGISYKDFLNVFGYDASHLPDGNFVCHGDLHPGNIIRTQDNQLFLIDFMNVCRGPKEYDVARTIFLITEHNPNPEAVQDEYLKLMNMTYDQIAIYLEAIKDCRKKEMKN